MHPHALEYCTSDRVLLLLEYCQPFRTGNLDMNRQARNDQKVKHLPEYKHCRRLTITVFPLMASSIFFKLT